MIWWSTPSTVTALRPLRDQAPPQISRSFTVVIKSNHAILMLTCSWSSVVPLVSLFLHIPEHINDPYTNTGRSYFPFTFITKIRSAGTYPRHSLFSQKQRLDDRFKTQNDLNKCPMPGTRLPLLEHVRDSSTRTKSNHHNGRTRGLRERHFAVQSSVAQFQQDTSTFRSVGCSLCQSFAPYNRECLKHSLFPSSLSPPLEGSGTS